MESEAITVSVLHLMFLIHTPLGIENLPWVPAQEGRSWLRGRTDRRWRAAPVYHGVCSRTFAALLV